MPTAVIYARQSSGSDDFSLSVEQQILNCKRLAADTKFNVIGIFQDLNTSGETYPAGAEQVASVDNAFMDWLREHTKGKGFRSGLGNLLILCQEKNVDALIVNEITRLYRPVVGSFLEIYINNFLRKKHIKIIQMQGGCIDLNRFDEHLINTIKNQVLFEDLQKKRANSIAGIKARKDSGKLASMPKMFGIDYLGHDKYSIDPGNAEIVRFVFNSVIQRKTYNSICKEVNKRTNRCMRANDIYRFIRQPLYCGYQYNTQQELIPNVEMQGKEIISFETWREANKIVDSKRGIGIKMPKKRWLPLSGRIYCGSCGDRLQCISNKIDPTVYYTCIKANTSANPEPCRKSRIRFIGIPGKNALHEITIPFLLVGLMKTYLEEKELHDIAREIDLNKAKYADMMSRETELLKMFSAGQITKEQFDEAIGLLRPKRMQLQTKMLEASHLTDGKPHYRINNIWQKFKAFRDGDLSESDYETYVEAAELQFKIYERHIHIHTFAFEIDIPRIRYKNHNWLPKYSIFSPAKYGREFTLVKPITVKIVTGPNWPMDITYKNIHYIGVPDESYLCPSEGVPLEEENVKTGVIGRN